MRRDSETLFAFAGRPVEADPGRAIVPDTKAIGRLIKTHLGAAKARGFFEQDPLPPKEIFFDGEFDIHDPRQAKVATGGNSESAPRGVKRYRSPSPPRYDSRSGARYDTRYDPRYDPRYVPRYHEPRESRRYYDDYDHGYRRSHDDYHYRERARR